MIIQVYYKTVITKFMDLGEKYLSQTLFLKLKRD